MRDVRVVEPTRDGNLRRFKDNGQFTTEVVEDVVRTALLGWKT